VNDIATGDPAAREALYDVIRSSGELFTATAGGKNFATILKELMVNAEDYATVGGAVYSSTTAATRENYNKDGSDYYVNTELRNGIKTLWPGLAKLFIRAKGSWDASGRPDYSPIYDPENGESALEYLTRKLYDLKQNCGIDFATYSIEDSLKRMVEYNGLGEKRSGASYKVSYLDHLLYTLAASNDFGYLTRIANSSNEPYANNSSYCESSNSSYRYRLHGTPVDGIMTVNDSLYSMTSNAIQATSTLGTIGYYGAYSLALNCRVSSQTLDQDSVATVSNQGQGDFIYRSKDSFNKDNANDYKFYLGYDFPTLSLLSGASVGDAGIPNGGRSGITPTSNTTTVGDTSNDYRTFYPYVGNGLGELNTGRWVMGWIARACWEGEGPYYYADTNAVTETIGVKTYRRYLRPDGRLYALVDTSTGEFFYPVDGGNDVAETDTAYAPLTLGTYQLRQNRYKAKWHTDYYLMKSNYANYHDGNRGVPSGWTGYYSPASVVSTTGINKFKMHSMQGSFGNGNTGDDLDAYSNDAGCLWFWEKIADNDPARACASQEEAMYRNFQWLILEKKFVFIMPMRSYLGVTAIGANIRIDALIFTIIEGNGIAGVANARRGANVGDWVLKGDRGDDESSVNLGHAQPNGVNYGDSHHLADGRLWILIKEDSSYDEALGCITQGDYVDINKVWSGILGTGNVLPNVVGSNIAPIARMAFLQSSLVASNSSDIGNTASTTWQNRNKLLPIVAALAGDLHMRSHYEPPGVGNSRPYWYNFTDAARHRYPLKHLRDMIGMLASPLMRYYKTPYTGASMGWWVPQIQDPSTRGVYAFFTPKPIDSAVNFYPNEDLRSTAQVLTESGPNSTALADGLIPALASTGMTTKLMALLQHLGAPGGVYADVDKTSGDYSQWGARRKMFYGLEQIVTSIKTTKSVELTRNYYGVTYPNWMFTADEARGDIKLDTILDELVGSSDNDEVPEAGEKGLAVFVDGRSDVNPTRNWGNYTKMVNAQGELMSAGGTTAGKYCILEDVITLTDKMLTSFSASPAQLRALRHTLGIVVAEDQDQNDTWEYPGDLNDIILDELPEILEVNGGHNQEFLTFMQYFLEEDGFVEYLVDHMNTSYSFAEIIPDLYRFLGDDIISQANSPLWSDLSDLLLDLCIVMGGEEPAWFDEMFQDNGPDFNQNIAYPGGAYTTLGELLSRRY